MKDEFWEGRFRIGLIGGRLQGVEAAYLAKEAGYHVTVIDREPTAPALALAHRACVFDILKDPVRFQNMLIDVDAVLPATEDQQTLNYLVMACERFSKPCLHDSQAFAVSSSKLRSNVFFANHKIPMPEKWPNCRFPAIVKPSEASGSYGVQVVFDLHALKSILPADYQSYGDVVIETFYHGPSLSLEVIARQGKGVGYLVTELEFDDRLDCKRVYAPSKRHNSITQYFEKISLNIAQHLSLDGLMDVEVIVDDQKNPIVVLEIDARFPSQTPMAVYHASGINLLEEWVKIHVMDSQLCSRIAKPGCAWLEHVDVRNKCLKFIGETRLLPWNNIQVWPDGRFFGATAALTDYQELRESFKATLIFAGDNWTEVIQKRQKCLDRMAESLALNEILDLGFSLPPN
jgi:3-methylornithine--L-lysine ligase